MNNLITQINVLAAGIELTIIVAGIVIGAVTVRLLIDLVKGDSHD